MKCDILRKIGERQTVAENAVYVGEP